MKFKIGDKVRVKINVNNCISKYYTFVPEMMKLQGKIVTIMVIEEPPLAYRIQEEVFGWAEDWLEPLEIKKLKLKDFVKK